VLVLYAVLRFVAIPGLPCELSPAKDCAPSDDAVALVPADAFAYAHLALDPDASEVERAGELADRLPGFDAIVQGAFQATGLDRDLSLRSDVFPWLGDEAAVAVVPGGDRAAAVALLAIGDSGGARRFLANLGEGEPFPVQHRGTELTRHPGGLVSAELEDFLLLGDGAAVRASIDAALGDEGALVEEDRAEELRSELPSSRFADAYVSAEGVALLEGRGGLAAQLDTFADFGASEGIAAALVAEDDGIGLELHSKLDPERALASPGFFAAFPRFEPGLAAELAPDTLAMLGIGDPSQTVRGLLDQADAALPGISAAFDRLSAELRRQGGVDVEDGLVPLLQGEAVAAIAPGRPVPYVTVVFDEIDERRVGEAVARLQAPLIAALDPGRSGFSPTFEQRRIGDVVARGLRISPAVELTYAVFDERLVASTDPRGVEHAIEGEDSLDSEPSYETVTSGAGKGVSALVFLDLAGLVELAEPLGLAEIVSGFRADLEKLRALGLTVRSGEDSLETRIFLEIAE
jgi:hypothetical protein